MEAQVHLNGSTTQKGNYVWGAALTLAWKNLCKEIICEPIRIQSENKTALQIVENYNRSGCDFKMMSPDCYYARAGFGNKTVRIINEEVQKKFPEKTTEKIAENLQDDSIISYAYFFKKLLFEHPFNKKDVNFEGKQVAGFQAKSAEQKKQVLVGEYVDEDNFLVELRTQQKNDHVLLLKSSKKLTPEQVLEKVNSVKLSNEPMRGDDAFEMPKVSLKHKRDVNELLGVFLANKKFQQYFFAEIFEIINLDLDQAGVKVENQGVVKLLRCGIPHVNRSFILNKPFWIVMRQKQNHPYFVAHITELSDK